MPVNFGQTPAPNQVPTNSGIREGLVDALVNKQRSSRAPDPIVTDTFYTLSPEEQQLFQTRVQQPAPLPQPEREFNGLGQGIVDFGKQIPQAFANSIDQEKAMRGEEYVLNKSLFGNDREAPGYERVLATIGAPLASASMLGRGLYNTAKGATDWFFGGETTSDEGQQPLQDNSDLWAEIFRPTKGDTAKEQLVGGGGGAGGRGAAFANSTFSPFAAGSVEYAPINYADYVNKPMELPSVDYSALREAFGDAIPEAPESKEEKAQIEDAFNNAFQYAAKSLMAGRDMSIGEMLFMGGAGYSGSLAGDRANLEKEEKEYTENMRKYNLQKAELEGKLAEKDADTVFKNLAFQNQYGQDILQAELQSKLEQQPDFALGGGGIISRTPTEDGKMRKAFEVLPTARERAALYGGGGGGGGKAVGIEKELLENPFLTSKAKWFMENIAGKPHEEFLVTPDIRLQVEGTLDEKYGTRMDDLTTKLKDAKWAADFWDMIARAAEPNLTNIPRSVLENYLNLLKQ